MRRNDKNNNNKKYSNYTDTEKGKAALFLAQAKVDQDLGHELSTEQVEAIRKNEEDKLNASSRMMESTSPEDKPLVVIISLDFDQMLADQNYADEIKSILEQRSENRKNQPFSNEEYNKLTAFIVENHENLFNEVFKDPNANYILMVGSNRQDMVTDINNAQKKGSGSCYPIFERLGNAIKTYILELNGDDLKIELNKSLYADGVNQREDDFTFNRAQELHEKIPAEVMTTNVIMKNVAGLKEVSNQLVENIDTDPTSFDNKENLLLFQMQKIATLYPGQKISFVFTDDHPEIINKLEKFFKKHTDMVPPNMELKLQLHNVHKDNLEKYELEVPPNGVKTYPVISSTAEKPVEYYLQALKTVQNNRSEAKYGKEQNDINLEDSIVAALKLQAITEQKLQTIKEKLDGLINKQATSGNNKISDGLQEMKDIFEEKSGVSTDTLTKLNKLQEISKKKLMNIPELKDHVKDPDVPALTKVKAGFRLFKQVLGVVKKDVEDFYKEVRDINNTNNDANPKENIRPKQG